VTSGQATTRRRSARTAWRASAASAK